MFTFCTGTTDGLRETQRKLSIYTVNDHRGTEVVAYNTSYQSVTEIPSRDFYHHSYHVSGDFNSSYDGGFHL